jgi:hypothetical protein
MDPALRDVFKSVGVNPDKLSEEQLTMMSKMYEGMLKNPGFAESADQLDTAEGISAAMKQLNVPRVGKKIGRNELCPCASKKKYKFCCLGKSTLPVNPLSISSLSREEK